MMTTASEADDQQPHPIFEWIFNGDLASLQTFLSTEPISTVHRVLKTFHRGQTPLTLSLTLCQTDITHLLLSTGQASPWLRNSSGWSPFQEATSVGSREAMAAVIKSHRSALESYFNNSDGLGLKALRELSEMVGDFSMDLEWRLRSGVPYLTGFCPSDSIKIYKHASSVRIDMTLVGFEHLTWLRGRVSLLLHDGKCHLVDHDRRVYQTVWPKKKSGETEDDERAIEEEVSVALNTPIRSLPTLNLSSVSISRCQSGVWPLKYDRVETVGPWKDTSVWSIDQVVVQVKERREHLPCKKRLPGYVTEGVKGLTVANVSPDEDEEDETLDKTDCDTGEEEDLDALMDKYKYGYRNVDEVPDPQEESRRSAQKAFQKLAKYRPSLDPPPLHPLSLKEFIMARTEGAHLGRAMDESLEEQSWQCTVWMSTTAAESENTETVTRVVQSVLSSPLFLELFGCEALVEDKEVFKKLPPGVPVQIEIPLLASLVASVLVRGVSPGWFPPPASEEEEQKDWFSIPDVDYREGVIL